MRLDFSRFLDGGLWLECGVFLPLRASWFLATSSKDMTAGLKSQAL